MAQIARPTSDISAGDWTPSSGSALYAMLDESSASDADFIRSGDSPAADTCEVGLGSLSDPASATGHIIRYRYDREGDDPIDLTMALYQGATKIAEWEVTAGDTTTTGEYTLTSGEANAITDYTNLRLRITADVGSTYLVFQNFEGTGFDNGETWDAFGGAAGTANPDYTTAPITGSQSLLIADDPDEGTYAGTIFGDDTGVEELWGYFQFKILDYPINNLEVFQLYNVQDYGGGGEAWEVHEMIWINQAGILSVRHGDIPSNMDDGAHTVELDTVHYIWWYVNRTTSGRTSGWVKVSETDTKPGTNDLVWSNVAISSTYQGTNSLAFTTFHGGGYAYVIDRVIVSDQEI